MEKFMPNYSRGYSAEFFRNSIRQPSPEPIPDRCNQPLAIARVADQCFEDIYTGECGLARGTIFAGLFFPLGNLNRGGGQFER